MTIIFKVKTCISEGKFYSSKSPLKLQKMKSKKIHKGIIYANSKNNFKTSECTT